MILLRQVAVGIILNRDLTTMGKSKSKNLGNLKKNLKTIDKGEMLKIIGGKNDKKQANKWNSHCGGILPQ